MVKKFDRNDWQGKRKDQVDYAAGAAFIAIVLLIVSVIAGLTSRFF